MQISAISGQSVRRDVEMFAGDEFTLTLTVYPSDDSLQSAVDMTGNTLTLKVYYEGVTPIIDYETTGTSRTPAFTIDGTEGATTTFAFTSGKTANLKGRYKLQIELTEDDLTRVLVNGALTIY